VLAARRFFIAQAQILIEQTAVRGTRVKVWRCASSAITPTLSHRRYTLWRTHDFVGKRLILRKLSHFRLDGFAIRTYFVEWIRPPCRADSRVAGEYSRPLARNFRKAYRVNHGTQAWAVTRGPLENIHAINLFVGVFGVGHERNYSFALCVAEVINMLSSKISRRP
jgi:hypothetical protein